MGGLYGTFRSYRANSFLHFEDKHSPLTFSGMPVYMIGHGLFGERHGLKPSVMKGNVAKVTRVNGVPAIVQVGAYFRSFLTHKEEGSRFQMFLYINAIKLQKHLL